jgi:hypothetical protein
MMKTAPEDCYVFDIDGTLADLAHRLRHIERRPKSWRACRHLSNVKPVRIRIGPLG